MDEILSTLWGFWPILVLVVVSYFFFYKPQKKAQAERRVFVASLKKGMRVVTTGGIHGTLKAIYEKEVDLEIAPKAVIRIDLACIFRKEEKSENKRKERTAPVASLANADDNTEVIEEVVEVEVDTPEEAGTEVVEEVVEVEDNDRTEGQKK